MSAQSVSGSISSRAGQGLRTLARLGVKFDPPLSLLFGTKFEPQQELFGAKFDQHLLTKEKEETPLYFPDEVLLMMEIPLYSLDEVLLKKEMPLYSPDEVHRE
ncbi:hypothetical protein Pmani_004940 [Petrolisthes manimaculis]|uniref:Uncharacterized protein n=1 Tax=Petrolisthes manimaculis TaxID=1843537 RepID=A0AAE1UNF8_9EUCA|nr:hypothetical protein Pmani_004940 [Petrolisthes manimaculis]